MLPSFFEIIIKHRSAFGVVENLSKYDIIINKEHARLEG